MTSRPFLACVSLTAWLATGAPFLAGCEQPVTSSQCTPPCPTGSRCEATGCVANGGDERDMTVGGVDEGPGGCAPACSGATPICRDGICVACVADTDCPTGKICKSLGARTTCVPGCIDDSRCGGGSMKCCNGGCTDTNKDAMNCGMCGAGCMSNHAGVSCAAGHCTLGNCASGWADCNADPSDGCEVNVRADAANCTACGMACALPNAIPGCSGGCYVRACKYGWDDCNGMENDGCETNVAADIRNCGACGMLCGSPPHGRVGCANSACILVSCDNGYADCDGQYLNGCEIGTATDINNCGVCGNKCGPGLVCVKGECTCPNCNLPNAKSACVNLKCVVGQCNQGYGDCDGQPQNGCERALLTDIMHCGVCGNACAQGLVCTNGGCTCPQCNIPGASSKCINNVCAFDKCLPGFGNCDNNVNNGCEADLTTDKNNCGACNVVCPQGQICFQSACTAMMEVKVGNFNPFNQNSGHSPNYLLGSQLVIAKNSTLLRFGVLSRSNGPRMIMALYTEVNGSPGALVASTPITQLTNSTQEIPVAEVPLPAGNYWIMANYDVQASVGFSTANLNTPVKYIALNFNNQLPQNFPGPMTYNGQEFNYYLVVNQ